MPQYQVICGNIGTVYTSSDKLSALRTYALYLAMSKSGNGRAGNEDVTLWEDDKIIKEYTSPNN